MSHIDELRQRISPDVRENEPMAPRTTFKIGGPAEYYYEPQVADDFLKAVKTARELDIPVTVFAGGSNVLVKDEGVKGLVIRVATKGMAIEDTKVTVDAGVPLGMVIVKAVGAGLSGMEWAVGIPGSVGGAVRGNAGTRDGQMSDVVEAVRAYRNDQDVMMTAEECAFDYRQSIFKREPDTMILSARLSLRKAEDPEALKAKIKELITKRDASQPVTCPSAGCIFMNWKPANEQEKESLRKSLDLNKEEEIPMTAQGTVPAGWIIDRAQLKGERIGNVMVSEKHANFFVTEGETRAADVVALIANVKSKVRRMTGGFVNLIEEVEYIGF